MADLKQYWNSFIESVKNAYYSLEDRYYDLIDWLKDHSIPLYKLTDFIDQYVPSFPVMVVFTLLLIFLFISFLFGTGPAPGPSDLTATVLVLDSERNPISNAQAEVFLEEGVQSFTTNSMGKFSVPLPSEELTARVKITAENFQPYDEELTLLAGLQSEVSLMALTPPALFEGKTQEVIVANDSGRKIINVLVQGNFTCTNADVRDPGLLQETPGSASGPTFSFEVPKNCGVLLGRINVSGFQEFNGRINSNPFIVRLQPMRSEESKGSLEVRVIDSNGSDPVSNATVKVLDAYNTIANQGVTDEDGFVRIDDLDPATYRVTAISEDRRTASKDDVVISAGSVQSISLRLPAQTGPSKKVFFQVTDANSRDPIPSSQALVYKGRDPISDILEANDNGVFSLQIAATDANESLYAFIKAENYVSQIVRLNVIPVNTNILQIIELVPVPLDENNLPNCRTECGTVQVLAVNSEDLPVESARVYLYSKDFPLIPWALNTAEDLETDEEGIFTFNFIPAGIYFARARVQELEGQSPEGTLVNGQTLSLRVQLILGKGKVQVTVHEKGVPANKLSEVTAQFVNALNPSEVIGSCITNAQGVCQSPDINADRMIAVRLSKQGFITTIIGKNGQWIDIIPAQTISVTAELEAESEVPDDERDQGISMDFIKYCSDPDCANTVTSFNSPSGGTQPRVYYALFELTTFADTQNAKTYILAGLENQLTAFPPGGDGTHGYKVKLDDVRSPVYSSKNLYSCQNPSDKFNPPINCLLTRSGNSLLDGKLALLNWNSLNIQRAYITAKFLVEPDLPRETDLELHTQSKGTIESTEKLSNKIDLHFRIGDVFCARGTQLVWSYSLEDTVGAEIPFAEENIEGISIPVFTARPSPGSFIFEGNPHTFHYSAYNCSGEDLSNSTANLQNTDAAGANSQTVFSGFPKNLTLNPFRKNQTYSFDDLILIPNTATTTSLKFRAQSPSGRDVLSGSELLLRFPITGASEFSYNVPSFLLHDVPIDLSGTVYDRTSNLPLSRVQVQLTINERTFPVYLTSEQEGHVGEFSIPLRGSNTPQLGQAITLTFSKPGYKPVSQTIPVQTLAESQTLKCIEFEDKEIRVDRSADSEPFRALTITNNCTQSIDLTFALPNSLVRSGFSPTDYTVWFAVPVGSPAVWRGPNQPITIPAGASFPFWFDYFQNEPMRGVHGITFFAGFTEDQPAALIPFYVKDIYIDDSSSCFQFIDPSKSTGDPMTYTLDFVHGPTTTAVRVQNTCFYSHRFNYPKFPNFSLAGIALNTPERNLNCSESANITLDLIARAQYIFPGDIEKEINAVNVSLTAPISVPVTGQAVSLRSNFAGHTNHDASTQKLAEHLAYAANDGAFPGYFNLNSVNPLDFNNAFRISEFINQRYFGSGNNTVLINAQLRTITAVIKNKLFQLSPHGASTRLSPGVYAQLRQKILAQFNDSLYDALPSSTNCAIENFVEKLMVRMEAIFDQELSTFKAVPLAEQVPLTQERIQYYLDQLRQTTMPDNIFGSQTETCREYVLGTSASYCNGTKFAEHFPGCLATDEQQQCRADRAAAKRIGSECCERFGQYHPLQIVFDEQHSAFEQQDTTQFEENVVTSFDGSLAEIPTSSEIITAAAEVSQFLTGLLNKSLQDNANLSIVEFIPPRLSNQKISQVISDSDVEMFMNTLANTYLEAGGGTMTLNAYTNLRNSFSDHLSNSLVPQLASETQSSCTNYQLLIEIRRTLLDAFNRTFNTTAYIENDGAATHATYPGIDNRLNNLLPSKEALLTLFQTAETQLHSQYPNETSERKLSNISFKVSADNPNVVAWIERNQVKAKYVGMQSCEELQGTNPNDRNPYPLQFTNESLTSNAYDSLSIQDLINKSPGR